MTGEPKFEAVLMRHGQTEWSVSGKHTGNTDIPLTPEGELEAASMKPHIAGHRYELVLSSPLQRALMTCEMVGLGGNVQVREDLREWDYGDYEGMTSEQIHRTDPDWLLWRDGCPGGESPEAVAARCDRIVDELLAHASGGEGDAIVFAHGHILRSLGARWCGAPVAFGQHLLLSTAAACSLSFEHGEPAIKFWNRTSQDR